MSAFSSMPEQWTPIARSSDLRGSVASVEVDGVPLALWRDDSGKMCAVVDRCPHRGARLSDGQRTEQGHLRCPFHGWAFDGVGACVHTPFDGVPRGVRARAISLPTAEAAGLVWVYTGERADRELALHPALTEPGWSGHAIVQEWDAHWTRATQTMLDISHIPVVHQRTIGLTMGRAIARASEALEVVISPGPDSAFRADWRVGDEDSGWVQFMPPNGVCLPIPVQSPRQWLLFIWSVPLSEGRSRQLVLARRNFGGAHNPLMWLADWFNHLVLREDRPNVERARPSEVPPPGRELSVASDATTIAFQTYYHRQFREGVRQTG